MPMLFRLLKFLPGTDIRLGSIRLSLSTPTRGPRPSFLVLVWNNTCRTGRLNGEPASTRPRAGTVVRSGGAAAFGWGFIRVPGALDGRARALLAPWT